MTSLLNYFLDISSSIIQSTFGSAGAQGTEMALAPAAIISQARYVWMLLELDYMPWIYNTAASTAHWVLLAGYLVIPGTLTSLQRSDKVEQTFKGQWYRQGNTEYDPEPPPLLLAIACSSWAAGTLLLAWLCWKWKDNYLWLINRVFMWVVTRVEYSRPSRMLRPCMMNSGAGLLTTLVNIYTARDGSWSVMALMTTITTAVSLSMSVGLFVVYKFIWLKNVRDNYESVLRAGPRSAGWLQPLVKLRFYVCDLELRIKSTILYCS